MKTLKNVLAAVLVVFTIQITSANDVKIRTNGNESVVIEINNETQNEKIKIYDHKGKMLFFENISRTNYLKTFAMNTLPSGQYYVEYENDNKVKIAIIQKTTEGQLITSDFSKISFKPMFHQKGDYLSVGFTNIKYENVDIAISDDNGFELVKIKGLNELLISKTFNTRKLPKGEYVVNVSCGNKSYSKIIDIK